VKKRCLLWADTGCGRAVLTCLQSAPTCQELPGVAERCYNGSYHAGLWPERRRFSDRGSPRLLALNHCDTFLRRSLDLVYDLLRSKSASSNRRGTHTNITTFGGAGCVIVCWTKRKALPQVKLQKPSYFNSLLRLGCSTCCGPFVVRYLSCLASRL
jgi:hypothetical protein